MAPRPAPPCALTIAGSDSGGGAGIQADLRTFAAHSVHGLCVLTAVTAQNTRAVTSAFRLPPREVRRQLEAVFDDFRVGAIKTGMLAGTAIVNAVADVLETRRKIPLVLDPVLIASSGARLIDERARAVLCRRLLPLARVVTPNLPEAEWLTGIPIRGERDAEAALARLRALGARAVLLKGGHARGGEVVDRLDDDGRRATFRHKRLRVEGHGTGCTLAAAIAALLARGAELEPAVDAAIDYVHGALQRAYRPGRGSLAVLDHRWRDEAWEPCTA